MKLILLGDGVHSYFGIKSDKAEKDIIKTLPERSWDPADTVWLVPYKHFGLAKNLPNAEVEKPLMEFMEKYDKMTAEEKDDFNHDYVYCPKCKSKHIFKLRIDSDWGGGSEYSAVNTEAKGIYTEKELDYEGSDRPDVEVYYCADCMCFFD